MNKNKERMRLFEYLVLPLAGLVAAPLAAQESDGEVLVREYIDATVDACQADVTRYCDDVEPGEGRMVACLREHESGLSELCAVALDALQEAILVLPERFSTNFPTLEYRELGTPNVNEDGEAAVWDRRLPFLAQQVLDLGFELPNPYGVALIPAWIRQELVLDNLAISINNGPVTEIDFVEFTSPEVENTTAQLKLDAWVLPFLNVFTTVGKFDGDATIPIAIEADDLFPNLCSIAPNVPPCGQTLTAVADPGYHGENITLGINLAMGWQEFFVTLPITYAWTEVNIIDTTVNALNISPRLGVTGTVGEKGMIAAFIGATYLSAEVDLTGQVSFDTPGGPFGDVTTVDFVIRQRNKDRWNYMLGFNWDINKNWSVMAEAGFGGTRSNLIAGATYRW